jgi:hypothetical protein
MIHVIGRLPRSGNTSGCTLGTACESVSVDATDPLSYDMHIFETSGKPESKLERIDI